MRQASPQRWRSWAEPVCVAVTMVVTVVVGGDGSSRLLTVGVDVFVAGIKERVGTGDVVFLPVKIGLVGAAGDVVTRGPKNRNARTAKILSVREEGMLDDC